MGGQARSLIRPTEQDRLEQPSRPNPRKGHRMSNPNIVTRGGLSDSVVGKSFSVNDAFAIWETLAG